jgi:hypothetical protein
MEKKMTKKQKVQIEKKMKAKSTEELCDSLGFAIHFELWQRAAIIRDIAASRGQVLEPSSIETYFRNKVKKLVNDKR